VATPASAVTRTVCPGASGTDAATDPKDPGRARPVTATRPPPSTRRTTPRGLADRWTPRKTTTASCCGAPARYRPGSSGSASRDVRTPGSPAGTRRTPAQGTGALGTGPLATGPLGAGAQGTRAQGTGGRPATPCPADRCRTADLQAAAYRTAVTPAACPTGRCPTAGLRMAACPMARLLTASLPPAPLPPAPLPPAGPPTAACPMAGRPAAGRCRVGSSGCRTGGGCRRARTASTGHRGLARRAGPRAGTTGPVRRPRTRTVAAGAGPPPAPACRRPAARDPSPEDRSRTGPSPVRLREVLTAASQGSLGSLGSLGLRRCASIRSGDASRLPTVANGWARHRSRPGR